MHFLLACAPGAFPYRYADDDRVAVGADDVARGNRVLQCFAARALRALRVGWRGGQQRPRVQPALDAANRAQREQVVDALDEGQLSQFVVQALERLQLRGGPQLGIAQVHEAAVIRAELARHAQVRLAVGVVPRDQSLETGVDGDARQPESRHQAHREEERQARRRAIGAEPEEALQEAQGLVAHGDAGSPANTAAGT